MTSTKRERQRVYIMNLENFSVDDFLADESFQSFALNRNLGDVEVWRQWLKEHPHKQKEAEEAIAILNSFSFAGPSRDKALFNGGLTKLENAVSQQVSKGNIKASGAFTWKIAATIALVLGVLAATYQYVSYFQEISNQVTMQRAVPQGQKLSVVLPDGSKVKMNGGSSIEYTQNEVAKYRRVALVGEAFFEVRPDVTKPFSVVTKGLITTAVGTSFNVKSYPGDPFVTVFLATGKVKVSHDNNVNRSEISLSPGLAVRYDVASKELVSIHLSEEDALSWREGIIKFSGANIDEVSAILERWYGVHVEVTNPPPSSWRIEGTFRNESLENVLKSLQYTTDMDYKLTDKELTLTFK